MSVAAASNDTAEPELTVQQRADVILNRTNVALARSQRLIQSWLPAPPSDRAAQTPDDSRYEAEEDDFKSMTENGGIGAKNAYGEEDTSMGGLRRTKLSSNDKLLEQLIGKKAAQVKRKEKERERAKTGAGDKNAAAEPRRHQDVAEKDSDDEGGRASAFKSRRPSKKLPVKPRNDEDEAELRDHKGNGSAAATRAAPAGTQNSESEAEERPRKRKAGSYLDELLSKKASKKSRKKTTPRDD